MPEYQSPGGAFSNAIEEQLARQALQKRQAMLDKLAIEKAASDVKFKEEEMKLRHEEANQRIEEFKSQQKDKDYTKTKNTVDSMVKGDIVSPDLLEKTQKYGIRLPTQAQPGLPIPGTQSMQTGAPVVAQEPPAGIAEVQPQVYQGSRADVLAGEERAKQEAYVASLAPGPLRQAAEYELKTGRNVPAGAIKAPGSETMEVAKQNPRTGVVERLVDGKWVPVTGPVPKGTHFMTEPAPPNTDAQELREENARNQAHQYAVTELNKIALPFGSQLTNLASAEEVLQQKTPSGDAHVAPMILKALVAGAGSGFRMTQSEINQVVGGRSRWQDLSAALRKWDTDPAKATLFDDAQRADFQRLIDEVRKKAQGQYKKVVKVRQDINAAKDAREIQKLQTGLQDELFAAEDEPTKESSAKPTAAELLKKYGGG